MNLLLLLIIIIINIIGCELCCLFFDLSSLCFENFKWVSQFKREFVRARESLQFGSSFSAFFYFDTLNDLKFSLIFVICNKIMNKSENTPSVTRFSLGFSPNKRFRSIFKDFNSFEILESLEFG